MSRLPDSLEPLDHTTLLLKRLFAHASAPLIASTLLACASTDQDPNAVLKNRRTALGSGPTCDEQAWLPTSSLSLPHEVDFASLRRNEFGRLSILSESGKPCEKASDPRLCEAEIDRVSYRDTTADGTPFMITSDGDTVRAFQTLAEMLTLLGEIDTPDEALLIAMHEGQPIDCASTVRAADGGYAIQAFERDGCSNEVAKRISLMVSKAGKVTIGEIKDFDVGACAIGRRPPGLCENRSRERARHRLARYFADAAHLEAAAVDAFEIMDHELAVHGAARVLRDAVRAAAEDETRHARDTTRLAERFGARAKKPSVSARRVRSMAEIALDNAVEGCVSETYGAYVATLQAAYAKDPELKRVLSTIAEDETRHAALSWQLAAALEPKLDAQSRRVIQRARMRAIRGLAQRVTG